MEQNLISMVEFSDPENETATHVIPYNFAMLNSHETGHLGKMIISVNSNETCGVGTWK